MAFRTQNFSPSAGAFIDLTDAPHSYAGQALKFVRVKATEDGLEFATGGSGASSLQQQDVTGTINGSNTSYTIVSAITSGNSIIVLNNLAYVQDIDYTISGTAITTIGGTSPWAADLAAYQPVIYYVA